MIRHDGWREAESRFNRRARMIDEHTLRTKDYVNARKGQIEAAEEFAARAAQRRMQKQR